MIGVKLLFASVLSFVLLTMPLRAAEICQAGLELDYVSVEELEGGLTPEGSVAKRWQLQFRFPEVIWSRGDMVEHGRLICDGEIITAEFANNELDVTVVQEPQLINMAGVAYSLSTSLVEP
ncbi:hypothetical protein [Corallincola holothuriorum]|uniref:hypothetical protein n=1 Tax=Corallincola holothuriorum TaxID=2282215 RepID=UPI000DF3E233|nr:hypothetical protein [Corallincola holothuriorum]